MDIGGCKYLISFRPFRQFTNRSSSRGSARRMRAKWTWSNKCGGRKMGAKIDFRWNNYPINGIILYSKITLHRKYVQPNNVEIYQMPYSLLPNQPTNTPLSFWQRKKKLWYSHLCFATQIMRNRTDIHLLLFSPTIPFRHPKCCNPPLIYVFIPCRTTMALKWAQNCHKLNFVQRFFWGAPAEVHINYDKCRNIAQISGNVMNLKPEKNGHRYNNTNLLCADCPASTPRWNYIYQDTRAKLISSSITACTVALVGGGGQRTGWTSKACVGIFIKLVPQIIHL